ncbi:MAG: hypothetical protein KDA95_05615 [Acidimicrobiales bacterium]|nr:hypothetical protein [Acidimicrobiales bacterium]
MTATRPFERELPPVVPVAMVALALSVSAGVLVSAQAMAEPSPTLPRLLVGVSLGLELVAVAMMVRIKPFAWARFKQVFGWAFLAYLTQSSIIAYSFVRNDVPSGPFVTLIGGLIVFATIVPLMIGFTVARYEQVG